MSDDREEITRQYVEEKRTAWRHIQLRNPHGLEAQEAFHLLLDIEQEYEDRMAQGR